MLDRVPGEAGRSLVQAYFETEHPRTSILHPQGQRAGMSSSVPFRTPVKPRKWPAPRTTTPPRRRSFRAASNAGITPGLGPHAMYGLTGEGYWVRQGTEMPPPPPFLHPTEIGRWSVPRATITPSRPFPQAGPSQRTTPYRRPHLMHGPREGGVRLPSSKFGYAASSYPSPAPGTHVSYTNANRLDRFYSIQPHGTLSFGS